MGFLAYHCGWSKDLILKNYTMSQVIRYCEEITELKRKELADFTESTMIASLYASGNMKNKRDYINFLEDLRKPLHGKKVDVDKTLENLKKFGIEIEEN